MKKHLSLLGLLCGLFCLQAQAGVVLEGTGKAPIDDEQSYVVKDFTVTPLQNGAGEVHQLFINTDTPLITQFQMVAVTLKNYQTDFYLQPSIRKALPIQKVALDAQALLAINGGYFTEDFKTDGLFIQNGKKISSYVDDGLISAWVGVDAKGHVVILPNKGPHSYGKLQTVMEIGPLLINKGNMYLPRVTDLNPFAMRTVLALSSDNELIVISSSAISLYTLENILYQHPQWFGVRKIEYAVNLDGGKSTALFLNDPKLQISVPEAQPLKMIMLFH